MLRRAAKITVMGKIDDIKQALQTLTPEEVSSLRDWLDELEEQQFDERLARDDKAGKLDKLAARALENLRAGKVRDL